MSSIPVYDFTGQSVIVVGGTSGIGAAISRAFAASGASVAVCGLPFDEQDEFIAELLALGATAAFFQKADVQDEAEVKAACDEVVSRFSRIDIAVNNAGIEGPLKPLHEIEAEEFDRLIAVNLRGIWCGLKHQIRHMIGQGSGSIINMSSSAGVKSIPMVGAYSATKHGIIGLTKGAALEQAANGIRVNAVAPGPVDTGLLKRMVGDAISVENIGASVPIGRIAQPQEIAQTVLWLASDASSFVTGETIVVDGGVTQR